MGRRSRGNTGRSQHYEKKIEHREWYTEMFGTAFDPASNRDVQLLAFPAMTLKSDDCTILRTRGEIGVLGLALTAADILRLVLGMIVLPAKYAAETSTLPNPLIQTDSDDWFVWQPATPVRVGNLEYRFEIDSKAMRKMESDSVVVPIMGIQSPLGAFDSNDRINFVGTVRILVGY